MRKILQCLCGYAYLGEHNNNKPFYTWGSGGVLYYSKFPIDEDSGAPDKFIPDKEVTPEIAKKLYYRCIRKNKSHNTRFNLTLPLRQCRLSEC